LDASIFEHRVTAGIAAWRHGDGRRCAEELRDALATWGGRPWGALEGWMPADLEAARLEELRRQAEEYEAAATLALGDHQSAAARLTALTAEEPLREFRWELLMRALLDQGRQAEALRAFAAARAHLVDELGIEPSPSLLSLERAVLDQTEPPVAPEVGAEHAAGDSDSGGGDCDCGRRGSRGGPDDARSTRGTGGRGRRVPRPARDHGGRGPAGDRVGG